MISVHPNPARRHLALIGFVGLVLAGTPWTAPEADPTAGGSRLHSLEQRVEELTHRLERLESEADSRDSMSATAKPGDIHWRFDAALSRGPFNVTHHSFDRGSGRFDVLLKVVAPIPDPLPWQVAIGAPVPVVAWVGLADGTASESLVFRLARGPKLDPGAVLHLEAQVPSEHAAAISGLSVGMRSE